MSSAVTEEGFTNGFVRTVVDEVVLLQYNGAYTTKVAFRGGAVVSVEFASKEAAVTWARSMNADMDRVLAARRAAARQASE